MSDSADNDLAMTIGAVSRATDIPANTLRTWERRYGFPAPSRTDGNQRLYPAAVVPHLRLVSQALAMGHRPRQVLALGVEQLRELVGHAAPLAVAGAPSPEAVEDWLRAARNLDGDALEAGFRREWALLGAMGFLVDRAAPFLERLGEAWADGTLSVYQEHAASERLRTFLSGQWRPLADRAAGASVICATLPGESHDLGLQMVAMVAALAGRRVDFLGADTPVEEIVACAARRGASLVLVSAPLGKDPDAVASRLAALRAQLEPRVELIVGGAGAPELPDVPRMGSLEELADALG